MTTLWIIIAAVMVFGIVIWVTEVIDDELRNK